MWRATTIAALAIAVAVACGGGGDFGGGDTQEPTATLTSIVGFTQDELTSIAEQALLRLDDFPTGWVARPTDDDEESGAERPPECDVTQFPGLAAGADSDEFDGDRDEQVENNTAIYVDAAAAISSMPKVIRIALQASSARCSLREVITTWAPSCASMRAARWPTGPVPATITARLPSIATGF